MREFISLVADFYQHIIGLLNATFFDFGAIRVSLGSVLFACLVTGFAVSVFWKGARA